jgi:DNA polymerase-3 subunit beta
VKIECSREELAEGLSLAGAVATGRTALPILQTIRLEAEKSTLTLLGCDGEMWAQRKILACVEQCGTLCVPAKLFTDVVLSLPNGNVTLELQNNTLFLEQGSSKWRMLALSPEEFPQIPEVEHRSELKLPLGELLEAIQSVSYATAEDEGRPVLTGVLFTYDGSCLTLVATDTHRLAVLHLDKPGIGAELRAIVPQKALKAFKNLPLKENEIVSIRFDETRLAVDADEAKIVAQLLAGSYPNWQVVVPSEPTRSWTFDRVEFLEHVKRAMILARDNANRVKFKGLDGQVQISTRSEDKGEAKEEVPAVNKNGEIEVAFNGRYVMDALSSIKSDGVRIEFVEPSRPAIFRGAEDGERHYCVIMPMMLG